MPIRRYSSRTEALDKDFLAKTLDVTNPKIFNPKKEAANAYMLAKAIRSQ